MGAEGASETLVIFYQITGATTEKTAILILAVIKTRILFLWQKMFYFLTFYKMNYKNKYERTFVHGQHVLLILVLQLKFYSRL